jgi:hypothetical protein
MLRTSPYVLAYASLCMIVYEHPFDVNTPAAASSRRRSAFDSPPHGGII